MHSFSALIEALGISRLAALFGIPESHLRVIKARDSLPPEYWQLAIEEARRQRLAGVTWKSLAALRDRRFRVRGRRVESAPRAKVRRAVRLWITPPSGARGKKTPCGRRWKSGVRCVFARVFAIGVACVVS